MLAEILVCLDGSPLAEKILPLAQRIACAKGATVILLRVLGNSEELSAEESYMRERAGVLNAPIRFLISPDPATAIIEELAKNPRAMPALTTHGRTAFGGSVIRKRGAKSDSWRKATRAPLSSEVGQFDHANEDHHPGGGPGRQRVLGKNSSVRRCDGKIPHQSDHAGSSSTRGKRRCRESPPTVGRHSRIFLPSGQGC